LGRDLDGALGDRAGGEGNLDVVFVELERGRVLRLPGEGGRLSLEDFLRIGLEEEDLHLLRRLLRWWLGLLRSTAEGKEGKDQSNQPLQGTSLHRHDSLPRNFFARKEKHSPLPPVNARVPPCGG